MVFFPSSYMLSFPFLSRRDISMSSCEFLLVPRLVCNNGGADSRLHRHSRLPLENQVARRPQDLPLRFSCPSEKCEASTPASSTDFEASFLSFAQSTPGGHACSPECPQRLLEHQHKRERGRRLHRSGHLECPTCQGEENTPEPDDNRVGSLSSDDYENSLYEYPAICSGLRT